MLNTQLFPFQCETCKKTFQSALGLNGHSKVHSLKYGESKIKMSKTVRERASERYALQPKKCKHCDVDISYEAYSLNHYVKFCSHSCAAKSNNRLRGARSQETREKISGTLRLASTKNKNQGDKSGAKERHQATKERTQPAFGELLLSCGATTGRKIFNKSICGAYSKVYRSTCKHCGLASIGSKIRKYCAAHANMYLNAGRNGYAFTINPFKFPDIFPAAILLDLKEKGFWSPSNRDGLTRDHKISVNEAIRNAYDPLYIKHPLNCELMGWQENNEKKARSSMSYEDLKRAVDEYEDRRSRERLREKEVL